MLNVIMVNVVILSAINLCVKVQIIIYSEYCYSECPFYADSDN